MNLNDLPAEIARSRVLSTRDAAEFCGYDVQAWRRMLHEGTIPTPIQLSERKRGWRVGDLVDFVNRRAAEAA